MNAPRLSLVLQILLILILMPYPLHRSMSPLHNSASRLSLAHRGEQGPAASKGRAAAEDGEAALMSLSPPPM